MSIFFYIHISFYFPLWYYFYEGGAIYVRFS
nr:MAG TPA: hypothetical protein [Caudoviricetes sp.]